VHGIDCHIFKVLNQKNNSAMHDLKAMYEKTLDIAKEMFADRVNECGDFTFKPRPAKMSDLQVISLAVAAESASIDSENWLFSKLRTDYKSELPELIDRSRFNRRRRLLSDHILELTKRISISLNIDSGIDLVDSMPCPIVKNSRERSYSICKEDPLTAPRKGYSAVDKRYYIGYKLHLLINEHGVFQDLQVTPANVHDLNFLKDLQPEEYSYGKTLLADKGYISQVVQTDLFTQYQIDLKVPYKKNQKNCIPEHNKLLGVKRRRIEVFFAQLCDQFRMKLNYAKSFQGFLSRLRSKIAAISVLQHVNLEKGRPLTQIKHAWA
jgi:hypothetical protein